MEFRVLGPLEVVDDGRRLNLGGVKQRALLGILLLDANRVVSAERLAELLWGDEPPETAPNVLQVYISQLRHALEPRRKKEGRHQVLVTQAPGYLLRISAKSIDLARFERLVAQASEELAASRDEAAAAHVSEALSLWRGQLLADVDERPVLARERSRVEELRLHALETGFDAYLRLNRSADVIHDLEALAEEWPLRERLQRQLMLALYRSGRQAEASAVFQRTRERLVDELGMEPGPELQMLLKQILNQDSSLEPNETVFKSQSRMLPIGTLTFLMTDIEGSTKVWDASPALARAALERHDQIILDQVERNHGQPVESGREGDSVLAVFSHARDAIACAFGAQRLLQSEVWPSERDVRVRIAVHTGEAELTTGHYVGAPLYRCARMMAVAYGGQVLVSKATQELVTDFLPDGITLRDLGIHRLRDISRPEHIYQLSHPSLKSDFPALRSEERTPNLPAQLTSFVGRQNELKQLNFALSSNRLVTLTGAGGCGKTRLAIQAAAMVNADYKDGTCFVDLAPVSEPGLIAARVAAALVLREEPGRSVEAAVIDYLAGRNLLLLLDNCEHLIETCAAIVGQILAAAPEVRVLATSQEPLNVPGEVRWAVPSLGLPLSERIDSLDAVRQSEAGQLFAERAQLAKAGFALNERTAPAVAQICRHLDGIPLAIELAAAQVALLTPNDIAARLDDRFHVLATERRLVAPRHRTLLAAVAWSHNLLSEKQKVVFRRLSVFSGAFDLDAAEALSFGSVDVAEVLALLSGLVEKSLVVAAEEVNGHGRYRLLETLRQFAQARMVDADEEHEARAAHFDHYLAIARRAQPHLLGHSDQSEWLTRLDEDLIELRAALMWGFNEDPDKAARLATCLGWFWWFRGYVTEGLDRMEMVLAIPTMEPAIRGDALAFAGRMAGRQGAHRLASSRFLEAIGIFRRLKNPSALAFAIFDLGTVARATGRFARARVLLDTSLAMWAHLGDDRMMVYAVQELGVLAMVTGDYVRSERLFEEAITRLKHSGERWGLALNLANLAELRIRRGDTSGARAPLVESLQIIEQVADPVVAAQLLDYAAMVAIDQGLAAAGLSLFAAGNELREHQRVRSGTAHRDLVARWRDRGDQMLSPSAIETALRNGLDLGLPAAIAMAQSVALMSFMA